MTIGCDCALRRRVKGGSGIELTSRVLAAPVIASF